ncbi:MAG: hypothetical protein AAF790_02090 [Planctomycetota bacterium]
MSVAAANAEARAVALHKRGASREALCVLSVGIRRDPDAAGLRMLRATIYHARRDWAAALNDAEVAQLLTPLPVGMQLVLGDCYARTGRAELALLAYRHLLTCGPLPHDLYAGLYAGFRGLGRHRAALDVCRAAVEAEPENHAAYFGMAHCMASLGYAASYIAAVLRSAVGLDPQNSVYRASLAIQLVRAAEPAEAYKQLRRVAVDALDSVGCRCSARKLLELCVWADDQPRAEKLGDVVRRLAERAAAPAAWEEPGPQRSGQAKAADGPPTDAPQTDVPETDANDNGIQGGR